LVSAARHGLVADVPFRLPDTLDVGVELGLIVGYLAGPGLKDENPVMP